MSLKTRVLRLDAGSRRSRVDTTRGRTRSLGGARHCGVGDGGLEVLAERNAFAEKTSPLRSDLLVDAIEKEHKSSLCWCHDGENDEEDRDDNFLWDEEHEVTEDPRKTNGDVDGNVDTELLLSVTLIGLGRTGESFVDFTTNEEEENSIGRDNYESGDEEGQETEEIRVDVANAALLVVWVQVAIAV